MDQAKAVFAEALALHRAGRFVEAEALYRRVLTLETRAAQAHNNLGAVLQGQGRFEEAALSHRAALAINPGSADAHLNLGAALQRLDQLGEAEACYRAALALRPGHAAASANLGLVLQVQGRLDEARTRQMVALDAEPDNPQFHNNLGLTLQAKGELDGAIAAFERAIALRPDFVEAHTHLGYASLLAGDLARGWREHEWRLLRAGVAPPSRPGPRWGGEDLAGRIILLQSEQGLGDAIQFVRYAPLVAERGGRVLVACRPPLRRLLSSLSERIEVLADEPPPAFDCWAPLFSLPALFETKLETIPGPTPYLSADPVLVERWRIRLADRSGLKVGVVWRGNPEHLDDRNRSIAPGLFGAMLDVPGVSAVSLQKDARPDELTALGRRAFDAGPELTDMADTAAVIANLDLVISVDTGVAHLAGALGARVWTLIPFAPDWRWMLDRDDSPWHPTMRLFRQPAPRDWASVIDRVRQALAGIEGGS